MFFRPMAETLQGPEQGAAQGSNRIFHLGNGAGMNLAPDEAIALQAAQGLSEHFLRAITDLTTEAVLKEGATRQ